MLRDRGTATDVACDVERREERAPSFVTTRSRSTAGARWRCSDARMLMLQRVGHTVRDRVAGVNLHTDHYLFQPFAWGRLCADTTAVRPRQAFGTRVAEAANRARPCAREPRFPWLVVRRSLFTLGVVSDRATGAPRAADRDRSPDR